MKHITHKRKNKHITNGSMFNTNRISRKGKTIKNRVLLQQKAGMFSCKSGVSSSIPITNRIQISSSDIEKELKKNIKKPKDAYTMLNLMKEYPNVLDAENGFYDVSVLFGELGKFNLIKITNDGQDFILIVKDVSIDKTTKYEVYVLSEYCRSINGKKYHYFKQALKSGSNPKSGDIFIINSSPKYLLDGIDTDGNCIINKYEDSTIIKTLEYLEEINNPFSKSSKRPPPPPSRAGPPPPSTAGPPPPPPPSRAGPPPPSTAGPLPPSMSGHPPPPPKPSKSGPPPPPPKPSKSGPPPPPPSSSGFTGPAPPAPSRSGFTGPAPPAPSRSGFTGPAPPAPPSKRSASSVKAGLIINALTYNTCWGCMSSNDKSKNDITAKALAEHCANEANKHKQNICATNIAKNIYNAFMSNTGTKEIDILGLQEATNWHLIKTYLETNGITNLGVIHHITKTAKGANAELCTMYNKNKFELQSVHLGDIGISNKTDNDKGRPFQIIHFHIKSNKRDLIVINIHNKHQISKEDLSAILSDTKNQEFIRMPHNDITYKMFENGEGSQNNLRISDAEPYIIFMGDTNDINTAEFWKGYFPLSEELQVWGVSSQGKKPENSCCIPTSGTKKLREKVGSDTSVGDYVLISDNLQYVKNNVIPTTNINHNANQYPASDHLPVLSIITPMDI